MERWTRAVGTDSDFLPVITATLAALHLDRPASGWQSLLDPRMQCAHLRYIPVSWLGSFGMVCGMGLPLGKGEDLTSDLLGKIWPAVDQVG